MKQAARTATRLLLGRRERDHDLRRGHDRIRLDVGVFLQRMNERIDARRAIAETAHHDDAEQFRAGLDLLLDGLRLQANRRR